MSVRYNQAEYSIMDLIGGFPQISIIGQDCYLCSSQDAADHICEDDIFRYIDDLEILELIMMTGILQDYNVHSHVPSNVPVDYLFLPPERFQTQARLDQLAFWTEDNKMVLNAEKCNYVIFSRSQEDFVTRLTVNEDKIDQMETVKILGCWIDQDAGKWSTNTRELCSGAYA
jgi:Zn ribbon nucleic-acid-binding protein